MMITGDSGWGGVVGGDFGSEENRSQDSKLDLTPTPSLSI
jgi:hypothetical protein